MLALAAQGLDEGVWLRAERQSGGRGRLGRVWDSPPGNIHASTLVRLRSDDPPAPGLALVAGVAVHGALSRFVPPDTLALKWPNDVLAGRAKLSGMLLEAGHGAVVVGVGVNVAHHPVLADRETTSLHALGAQQAQAEGVMRALADSFAAKLSLWRSHGIAAIRAEWIARAHPAGTPLRAALPDGEVVESMFDTLDPHGNLILCLANGRRHVIHAGDVFLL